MVKLDDRMINVFLTVKLDDRMIKVFVCRERVLRVDINCVPVREQGPGLYSTTQCVDGRADYHVSEQVTDPIMPLRHG